MNSMKIWVGEDGGFHLALLGKSTKLPYRWTNHNALASQLSIFSFLHEAGIRAEVMERTWSKAEFKGHRSQRRKKPRSAPQVGQTTNWNLKGPHPDNSMKSALKQGALVLMEMPSFLRRMAVGQDRGRHLSSHATVFLLLATCLSMFCQKFLSTYHDW